MPARRFGIECEVCERVVDVGQVGLPENASLKRLRRVFADCENVAGPGGYVECPFCRAHLQYRDDQIIFMDPAKNGA